MTPRIRLTSCVFSLTLLSACNTVPTQNQPFLEQAARAESLMSTGRHQQAARLYQNLAEKEPTQQNQFRLLAAKALVRSGDHNNAKHYADGIDPTSLTEQQRQQLNLIYAQIDLSYGNAEQALERLHLVRPELLDNEDRKNFYSSQAFAYSLTGNLLASAKARIKLHDLLTSPQQINENNRAILESLILLPELTLNSKHPPAPNVLSGWMELADLLKQQHTDNVEFLDRLLSWRRDFPYHPANSDFLQNYLETPKRNFKQPGVIAIMLPESGPYVQAGRAIREGLMAAYYQQQKSATQPTIRFYDSQSEDPAAIYHQAIANGAELVIGPLQKDKIALLAAHSELTVPVLALNHVDNLSKNNLYQFGLSPLDEARQLASRVRQDNHQKVIIFTPEGDQGERIASYLADAWMQIGGTVLAIQTYSAKAHDFSYPIKHILNLDDSEHRYRQLRNLLGRNLEYTPSRRHDVDAILINAPPTTARSLNPQLDFYHAMDVPVYATPLLYSGVPDPSRDIDLNNITFCDIPWLFSDSYRGELSQESLRDNWQKFPTSYLRLIALGIDAYGLTANLGTLDTVPFQGATGTLLLNGENRITRQLVCAKFTNGIPNLSEFIDRSNDETQHYTVDSSVPAASNTNTADVQ